MFVTEKSPTKTNPVGIEPVIPTIMVKVYSKKLQQGSTPNGVGGSFFLFIAVTNVQSLRDWKNY